MKPLLHLWIILVIITIKLCNWNVVLEYKLTIHESSFYRIKNEVDDMNKLLNEKHI
ncbi:hypothetical protein BCR36DRAFT_7145 [Piromyces finnis]|uniref:Uncharacterized protein n=1 Tax=Piromyces finnis TaxID=1754191 RepID=A0A1Y1VPD7_9FUNG|nr:hypothetical protein BCR36DRAFT_7145 [Piromyces finnis]|eukprot:ORX61120.1 hypothetical protein BCR36DRAFT_7145 [Piromyces finnis]